MSEQIFKAVSVDCPVCSRKTEIFNNDKTKARCFHCGKQFDVAKPIEPPTVSDNVTVMAQQYALANCQDDMSICGKVISAVEYGYQQAKSQPPTPSDAEIEKLALEEYPIIEKTTAIRPNCK